MRVPPSPAWFQGDARHLPHSPRPRRRQPLTAIARDMLSPLPAVRSAFLRRIAVHQKNH
ncbi:hypothetical protein PTE31013_01202 [Pandoraea terrigena]|uniref:Uncharacterized protein n=1 Tax=Pandoraea terrigena TaxID=2508292 RepID=A0A5E4T9S0_9BURK|nr:hypothetical protein PTE31013_01202 [Pandoraea terrigena]